jgi:SNF family Na+-dependent transporter
LNRVFFSLHSGSSIVRHSLIVAGADFCTSIFAGFAIFSTTGYLAHAMGKEVKDVIKGGLIDRSDGGE